MQNITTRSTRLLNPRLSYYEYVNVLKGSLKTRAELLNKMYCMYLSKSNMEYGFSLLFFKLVPLPNRQNY